VEAVRNPALRIESDQFLTQVCTQIRMRLEDAENRQSLGPVTADRVAVRQSVAARSMNLRQGLLLRSGALTRQQVIENLNAAGVTQDDLKKFRSGSAN
jgi:hypothetical protein